MLNVAVVNAKINYLEEKTKLKKEKIKETLEVIGFPCEISEDSFWIEITPNRPDCYLVQGIIRTINSFMGKKKKRYKAKKAEYRISVDSSVEKVRPYISSCVVKNITINDDELEQLIDAQEKMHETMGRKRKKLAIGVHNLDVIEFPLKYKAVKEYGFVPLEFSEKMTIEDILEKHPKGVEYAHLVEKGKYPLIYEKKSGDVVSFPPIINEDRTKLDKKTKNILIEITGMHKESVENAVCILACSLQDLGGEIYEVKVNNEKHPKLDYKKERIKLKEINRILGCDFSKQDIKKYLEKMGYFVGGKIEVPPFRGDIIDYIDIVEDVAIGRGYEEFEPTIPNFFTSGKMTKRTKKEKEIRDIMNGMGFIEITTPLLINKKSNLKVINPCSVDYGYVREELMDSVLEVLEMNKMKGIPQKIYEIGVSYDNKKEKRKVAFVVMSNKVDFNEIRGILQTFVKEVDWKVDMRKEQDKRYKKDKCAKIFNGKKEIGIMGEITKNFLEEKNIGFEVGYCEIELN